MLYDLKHYLIFSKFLKVYIENPKMLYFVIWNIVLGRLSMAENDPVVSNCE